MEDFAEERERKCSLQEVVGEPLAEEEKQRFMGEFGYNMMVLDDEADGDKQSYDPGRAPRKKRTNKSDGSTSTTTRLSGTSFSQRSDKELTTFEDVMRVRPSAGPASAKPATASWDNRDCMIVRWSWGEPAPARLTAAGSGVARQGCVASSHARGRTGGSKGLRRGRHRQSTHGAFILRGECESLSERIGGAGATSAEHVVVSSACWFEPPQPSLGSGVGRCGSGRHGCVGG